MEQNNHEKHLTKIEEKEIKIFIDEIKGDLATLGNRKSKEFKTLKRYSNGDEKEIVKMIFNQIIKDAQAGLSKLN